MKKRLISFLLTVVMLASLCTVFTASASAEPTVTAVPLPAGGNVVSLCASVGVNYYEHKNLIMNLNGVTSESQFSKMAPGTSIVLPVSEAAAAALEGGTAQAAAMPLAAGTTAAVTTAAAGTVPAGTVPAGQTTALPAGDTVAYYLVWYTVQRGQTIDSIYRDWGLNYRTYDNQIRKLNNITSYNNIGANKTLLLPTTNPAVADSAYYTVMAHIMKNGESAYDIITNQYGLNYNSIQQMTLALNNTTNLAYIYANTTLYIPVSGIVSPSTTVSPTTAAVTTTATVSTSANYNLVSQTAVNGSFAMMVDGNVVTTAQAGKIVNIVATPDIGYGLDSVRVTKVGDSNTGVAVNNNCFVMPNYSVIVSVTFKQVASYNISIDESKNGNVVAMVNGNSVTKGYVGSTVTVRAIPKAGFLLDNIRVTYNNRKDSVAVENNKFVMPATNVTVTASFVTDPDYDPNRGNLIYISANNCDVTAAVANEKVQYAKKGDLVALNVQPKANYTVTSVKVYNSDFTQVIATDKSGFIMPDGPVNVVVEAMPTASASFPINVVDPVNGEVYIAVNEALAESAIVGQTVTVYGNPTKQAYNYLTTVYKTNDPSVAVPVEEHEDGSASFVMPDFEVTVRVKFYTYYNVRTHASNGQYGTYGIVWNENQNMYVEKAGAGVKLKVGFGYIAPGYSVSEIMLIYADGSTYTLDDTTFIMPDCDVTVKVNFTRSAVVRAYSISENDSDKANVYPQWGNIYTVGETALNDLKPYYLDIQVGSGSIVTVTPYAAIGYLFDKFVYSYKDTNGNLISHTVNYLEKNPTTLKYQFLMPSADELMPGAVVELKVYFREVRTYSILQDYTNSCDPAKVDTSNADHHMGTYGFLTVYDYCDHAAEDTKLYIRSEANTGYVADLSGVKIYRDNKNGTYTDVTADPDVNYDPTNYSFFMPPYDIKIYVPFTESMFWVNLEKSFDASRGLARGELTLVVNGTHFTEETLTLTGEDKNNTRKVFEPGTLMKVVNTSNTGYFLNSRTPFSIYRVDKLGNYITGDIAKSLMLDGSVDTFVMPAFNISIKANYDDEIVTIVKAPCEHGSFTVPAQAPWNAPFNITEIYPEEGYELSQILLSYTDFSGTPHKEESIDIASVIDSSRSIELAGGGRPQSDVTVKVVFKACKNALDIKYNFSGKPADVADYYNVNLDAYEIGSIEITRGTAAWPERVDTAAGIPTGAYVRLGRSEVHYDANFSISNVTIYNGISDTDKVGFPVEVTELDGYYFFYMPYVSENTKCVITVNYSNLDEYSFYLSDKATGDGDTEFKDILFYKKAGDAWESASVAKPGDPIAAVFKNGDPAAPADAVGELRVYAIYTDSDGVTHRALTTHETEGGSRWTFSVGSMPVPATVALEYVFEADAQPITDAKAEGCPSEFWVDGEMILPNDAGQLMAVPGKTVTVKPVINKVPAGKVPVSISTDPAAEINDLTFVMPAAPVTVTVNFSEALSVGIDPSEVNDLLAKAGYAITTSLGTRTDASQIAHEGDEVIVKIIANDGYMLVADNIKAYDNDGEVTVYPTDDPSAFKATVRTSSLMFKGFAFVKVEKPFTWRYESSPYDKCTFYKNNETVPMVAGVSTLGANDVITFRDENGEKIKGYVPVDARVNYKTVGDVPGTYEIDPYNESIRILNVPTSDIELVITFARVQSAYELGYYAYESEKAADTNTYSVNIDSAAWDETGKVYEGEWVKFTLKVRYDKKLVADSLRLRCLDKDGNQKDVTLEQYNGGISGGDFSKDGLEQVYSGGFVMPGADTKLVFKLKDTEKFYIEGSNSVFALENDRETIATEGKLGSPIYVAVAKAKGYTVDGVTANYYVHDATKPKEGDFRSVSGTKVSGQETDEYVFFTITIPKDGASMGNTVYLKAQYAENGNSSDLLVTSSLPAPEEAAAAPAEEIPTTSIDAADLPSPIEAAAP